MTHRPAQPRRRYTLVNEHLLEFPAHTGTRSVCHLLVYGNGTDLRVCIVGNFDAELGSPTGPVIELVATAVADQIQQDCFQLIEWYPRHEDQRFTEVELTHVAPTPYATSSLAVDTGEKLDTVSQKTLVTRYIHPRWTPRSEDDLAELLGEPAVRDLRSFAGMTGDYTPERLFGSTGAQALSRLQTHNQRALQTFRSQVREWTDA